MDSPLTKFLCNANIPMLVHNLTFKFVVVSESANNVKVASSRVRWWLTSIIVSQGNSWISLPGLIDTPRASRSLHVLALELARFFLLQTRIILI